jgi:Uma2 family endonuclease
MATTAKRYTAEDLWLMPADAPYELRRGELVEVPPSGLESSAVALRIGRKLGDIVEDRDLGVASGEAGGYILFPDQEPVVAPDVGFVRCERVPERKPPKQHCPVPPDLAVEVASPSDEPGKMADKLALYLEAGVPLLWWVDLGRRTGRVHRPGRPVQEWREGDALDGADVLPGFRLAVADIFTSVASE